MPTAVPDAGLPVDRDTQAHTLTQDTAPGTVDGMLDIILPPESPDLASASPDLALSDAVPDTTPDATPAAPDAWRGDGVDATPESTSDAPTLPDAIAAVDTEPLAPLQECTPDQQVSLIQSEPCGIVNGLSSPTNVRFWPGPLAIVISKQCYFNCSPGGPFPDSGVWTACAAILDVPGTRTGVVCVSRAANCDLCVTAN